ncbi:hypothetical protein CDO73_17390 [Saccharibacillus sp. O23]|uniref:hypothetical protein n=1 Tax=Saccharibacillus sp. O23 TaxID=2009338 RepID=UPI000B4DF0F1|nr:hypothetical protein [Saccharibacillus sp. O23]OWR28674.1 hypothetical protein CDO73_17390 [Saccharibacillus sp. O23]
MQIDLEHRAADSELLRGAALGEEESLDELRRRNVLFGRQEGVCFAVSEYEDGRQSGFLAEHARQGGGVNRIIRIPASWRISSVSIEEGSIVLTSADGRTLSARPEQFHRLRWIRSSHNPAYESQLEDDFLKLPAKMDREADEYIDEQGRCWSHGLTSDGYWLQRISAEGTDEAAPPAVCCDAQHRTELSEMLPTVLARLERIEKYAQAAAHYLWLQGSDEEREALDQEAFGRLLEADSIVFGYYGDFELWMAEPNGELFDGYSPTVYFDAAGRAIDWAMNA